MLTLLVLAAGIGSRYGGLKQIDPLGVHGEIAVDYALYDAWRAGFQRVVFIIRSELEPPLREHFTASLAGRLEMDFVIQDLADLPPGSPPPAERTKPWGTGHAVWSARQAIRGPFAVVNADDFYGLDAYVRLAEYLSRPDLMGGQPPHYALVGYPLARTLSSHGTVSRAICRVGGQGLLETIVEQTKVGHIPAETSADRTHGVGGTRSGAEVRSELERTSTKQREAGSQAPIGWQDDNGGWHLLRGDEPVSMNMWGFNPAVFPQLEWEFSAFLKNRSTDPKAEFYIPLAINHLIQTAASRVEVLTTTAAWFGMTYPKDRPGVQDKLHALITRGEYPAHLWE
jgi:hypothetical protein